MANENLTSKMRKEIHKEARSQAAKGIVAAVIALIIFAGSGWWLYMKPKIVELAGGVPPNTVAAFDTANGCPNGWKEFEKVAGRVIVGEGSGFGLSKRGYREEGGTETHTLTENELPSHKHGVLQMVGDNNVDGVDSTTTHSGDMHNQNKHTQATGENAPHNNMQPFLVLKFCKKL